MDVPGGGDPLNVPLEREALTNPNACWTPLARGGPPSKHKIYCTTRYNRESSLSHFYSPSRHDQRKQGGGRTYIPETIQLKSFQIKGRLGRLDR